MKKIGRLLLTLLRVENLEMDNSLKWPRCNKVMHCDSKVR